MKNCSDTIGNRARDLPACGVVVRNKNVVMRTGLSNYVTQRQGFFSSKCKDEFSCTKRFAQQVGDYGTESGDNDAEQVIMVPNQVIMAPNQVIMAPNQVIMAPNQVIMVPNQVIMAPNQVIIAPNQVIMVPNQVIMVPNRKDFFTRFENAAEQKRIKIQLLLMTRKWRCSQRKKEC